MIPDRFWDKVNKTPSCWLWTASTVKGGYGQFSIKHKRVLAHIFIYQELVSPIPDGLNVLHKCDNPLCVNPDHLFLGTAKDNLWDAIKKNRWHPIQTFGSDHYMAKLNDDDILQIRKMYESGNYTYKQLSQIFNVCKRQIGRIIKRQSWQWLS